MLLDELQRRSHARAGKICLEGTKEGVMEDAVAEQE